MGITEKKSSLLLDFDYRPHSSEGLSWQCWCSGSLTCMDVTLGLLVLPLLSIMISIYMLVPAICFIWLSGLLETWVIIFFSFFPPQSGLSKAGLNVFHDPISWCMMPSDLWLYRLARPLCSPLSWLHGQECRTRCGMRWGCSPPGAQGIGERTAEAK